MTQDGRIDLASEMAQNVFWAEVARSFPEIRTGDFCPQAEHRLNVLLKEAVRAWVRLNDVDLGVTIADLLGAPTFPEVENLLREAMDAGNYWTNEERDFNVLSYQEHSRRATELEQYEVALLAAVVDEIATRVDYNDPIQGAAARAAIGAEFTSASD